MAASAHIVLRALRGLLVAGGALVALFAVAGAAHAATPAHARDGGDAPSRACALSLTSELVPGASVEVDGSGYDPDSTVQLVLQAASSFDLGRASTDHDGAFRATVVVPQSITASQAALSAQSADTICSVSRQIETAGVDAIAIGPIDSSSGSELARPGRLAYLAVGVGLAGAVFMYVVIGRRRVL